VWDRWLNSYPELGLLDLDVGRGQFESRKLKNASLATHLLMPYDEKALQMCLESLIDGDEISAAALVYREASKGALLPDIFLLAGAFRMSEGRLDEAAQLLGRIYQGETEPGLAIRRMCPSLRFLVRLTPCVLLPLYPNVYAAELMYALATWRSGNAGEGLQILREMVERWGLFDELKLAGGLIHLERGDLDRAIGALSVGENTERDAMELARALYLAYAHLKREEFRSAVRALVPVMQIVRDVNPHLHARARQLLAELYERNGLMLNALRESGKVLPNEVPADVAKEILGREERWVTELSLMSNAEVERLAHADSYQVYLPDEARPKASYSPLDTSRNVATQLKPRAMSWIKRQEEQRKIDDYRAALARGESVLPPGDSGLSPAGADVKKRIAAAERWWVSRRQALSETRPSERLARANPFDVGHLRIDFCGGRKAPTVTLMGEKRLRFISILAGASLVIFVCLLILHTCVY